MIEAPAGWRVTRLADLLILQNTGRRLQQGWSPRCHTHPVTTSEAWGVLKTTAIQPGRFDQAQHKELPPGLAPRPLIEVSEGDLLMTCAGPRSRCGVPALVRATRPRLMMSGKMYRFRPTPNLDSRFLEMWLLSPEAQTRIDGMKTGISDSGLNLTQDRFLELPVPVPPLREQLRIVEILEDHFSRLDAGLHSLRQSERRLDAMRAVSLHLSVIGPARSLGELSIASGYGTSTKCSYEGTGAPVIRIPNLVDGHIDLTNLKRAIDVSVDLTPLMVREGDVLIVRTNGSRELIGRSAVVGPGVDVAFASYLIRYQFEPSIVRSQWVQIALESRATRRTIEGLAASSAGQHNLSLGKLDALEIPCPDVAVQDEELARLSSLDDQRRRLARAIGQGVQQTAALRRALLAAAFSGKLTGRHTDDEVIEEMAADA